MVNQTQFGLIFPVKKNILSNADIRHQRKLLIYCYNSPGKSLLGPVKLNHLSVQPDLPFFRFICAEKTFCKRTLACAVLTHQDMYFPFLQIKIHIIQGLHARKKFGDMLRS